MIWALDASVAIKWFFTDEPRRDAALAVREHLGRNPRCFVVPHLFLSEMTHVLARKSACDSAFVSASVQLLLRVGLRTLSLTDQDWQTASQWCCRGLSGYDATYVALASQLRGRWLTDDAAAAKKAPDLAVTLANWSPIP